MDTKDKISGILENHKPALLIGNGVNQFGGKKPSSWENLLAALADRDPPKAKIDEMSLTEFFDIIDLTKTDRGKKSKFILQQGFRDHLERWKPSDHHGVIASWAQRHDAPIVTVNFDENLSKAINAEFHQHGYGGKGFSHWYPWGSYFSDREIKTPRDSFAIWHAHGMMRYKCSIRLGLTHYMGSAQRARWLVYRGEDSLRGSVENGNANWRGRDTWLDAFFFCPLLVFGFRCNRDESLMRWLFVERARFHKLCPEKRVETWFLDTPSGESSTSKENPTSRRFFESLDMEYVPVSDFGDIYGNPAWCS